MRTIHTKNFQTEINDTGYKSRLHLNIVTYENENSLSLKNHHIKV